MTLQELIDELSALKPDSARSAQVGFGKFGETAITSISYSGGAVSIDIDGDLGAGYDEGYEVGKRDGIKEAEEGTDD